MDLALNNSQWLICDKTKPSPVKQRCPVKNTRRNDKENTRTLVGNLKVGNVKVRFGLVCWVLLHINLLWAIVSTYFVV